MRISHFVYTHISNLYPERLEMFLYIVFKIEEVWFNFKNISCYMYSILTKYWQMPKKRIPKSLRRYLFCDFNPLCLRARWYLLVGGRIGKWLRWRILFISSVADTKYSQRDDESFAPLYNEHQSLNKSCTLSSTCFLK